jgi:oligoendopeptidase F
MKAKTTWDLTQLFKNEKEIKTLRQDVEKHINAFVKKWEARSDYLTNPKVLKKALNEYSSWATNWGSATKESFYYHLKESLDQNDTKLKAKINKTTEYSTKLENQMQFFTLRISKIDKGLQGKLLKDKLLTPYKHFLEKLFAQADHLLSEPEEKILNTVAPLTYSNWTKMLSGFLAKEESKLRDETGEMRKNSFSEIVNMMSSTKKIVRDKAAIAFNEILDKHLDVAENEINAVLQYKKVSDELRGFQRPDSARHLSDDVDTTTVDTLLKTVSKNFAVSQRYYTLKAKLMGVKKLSYHERNVPYGSVNKKYSYSEASDLVKKVFENLDTEFSSIFSKFEESGNIDIAPKKGKRSGAFATTQTLKTPTFILLNHTGELSDVATLAHELGHGINNELIRAKQNELNFGTPTSTAEVASTFMEDFVFQELLNNADDKTKLSLMMSKLNDDISTIFRQIAFYNFELELHKTFREKGYVSKEEIGKIFQKHMISYMGSAVSQDNGAQNWWVYVSHFRYYFYVYSYASGLLISKSLQASVKKNPEFIKDVKEFLRAGTSDSPKNIFLRLGVDITKATFWEKGVKEIEELLVETEKLAKKLKTI